MPVATSSSESLVEATLSAHFEMTGDLASFDDMVLRHRLATLLALDDGAVGAVLSEGSAPNKILVDAHIECNTGIQTLMVATDTLAKVAPTLEQEMGVQLRRVGHQMHIAASEDGGAGVMDAVAAPAPAPAPANEPEPEPEPEPVEEKPPTAAMQKMWERAMRAEEEVEALKSKMDGFKSEVEKLRKKLKAKETGDAVTKL